MRKILCFAVFCSLTLSLSACARYEVRYDDVTTGTRIEVTTPILEQIPVEVPIPPAEDQVGVLDYRVGPGDVLAITIPGQRQRVDEETGARQGYRIYSSGKVLLPIVGGVPISGLTVDEVQLKLNDVFRTYIKEPVVSVEVLEYKSQAIYLMGSFNTPGVQYLDRPVTLIQGVALGGGLSPTANLRGARVVRENRVLPVDIYELMYNNDLRHNVPLRPNDTLFIPGDDQGSVFVLGAVKNEGQIPMQNGRLTLLQALSTAGLGSSYNFDAENVRIIRSFSATRGELLVVDLNQIKAGRTLPLPLMAGDIIYVPNSAVANWNDAISQMLPSLQAIGAVIQPFVQIQYLKDAND
jgi:polysaccharide export outer membrane protein